MSKNTNISELINYLSYDGSGNIVFHSLSAASTNTDKFLVSDGSTLKHRTAAQLLSDIGAQASGSYQAALSGTGFVKISGSTISYDNSTYATETYVGTAISNLVASSPATLDTLNELALALGSDPNFATTVATSIGTKQAQLNGTGFVKVTGTTVSYDNSTYLTTGTASSTYLTTTTAGTTYVPYTGGTANVNLGVYNLAGGNVNINGGGSGGGALRLKQYGSSEANLEGYNSISTLTSGVFYFTSSASVPNFKNFVLNPSGLTDNTVRTYALPDASGTLALTSDLSSYLPLAGGTLTNTLSGTSANFSGNVVFNRASTSAGNNIEWRTANTLNWYIGTRGLVDNNFYFVNEGLAVNNLILNASTGAATFSNSITSAGLNLNSGGVININTQNGFQLGADSASGGFYVYDNTNSVYRLKISNAGATVLSGALTIGGALSTGSPIYSSSGTPLTFTNNGNSGTYTQTTIYVNQNNTSGNTANGIFIERGKISDAGGAETRHFVIGARGGSIQWLLDGSGSSSQTGNMSAVDVYATGAVRYNGAGLNASDKKLYSPVDGELQWMTHSNAGAHAFSISHQGTRQVYLDVSGNSYFTGGNLGIGLNNPSQKLHVAGNIYSTDTVFGRNLKPEAFAGPAAGSPTGASIPIGYSTINISSLCDNSWRTIMSQIGDSKIFMWVALGDAASKNTGYYTWQMTSPAYGVANFTNIHYLSGGWNTGGFEFTYDASGGNYRLLVRTTSYYSAGNTAYGTIYFLRLE